MTVYVIYNVMFNSFVKANKQERDANFSPEGLFAAADALPDVFDHGDRSFKACKKECAPNA